jgi:hypothetical protein
MPQELVDRNPNVLRNPAKQDWGDVAARVERERSRAAVGVAKLLVGAALARFLEPQSTKDGRDLARLQNRQSCHG